MSTRWNEFNDLNVSEFSSVSPEWTEVKENKSALEMHDAKENTTPQMENGAPQTGKKKSKMSDFITKMVVLSLVATTSVVGVSIQANAVDVELLALEAYKTALYYQIEVEETESDLVLIVKNEFTNREYPLSTGINQGEIIDLVADMPYTLIVKNRTGLGGTIKTYTARTLKDDPPVTQFYDLTYTAAVNKEGTFTFTPNFIDEKGIWSNISAELVDSCGYGSVQMNIENADTMYEMNLSNTRFATSIGSLSLWADVLQENGQSVREKLYELEVDLMQTRTYIQSVTFIPVDAWGEDAFAYIEYVDENGFWEDGYVYHSLQGDNETGLSGWVSSSGEECYYTIYEGFCNGKTLQYELSVYINGSTEEAESVIVYLEEVVVKSADFDETSGGGTSSSYST